MSNSINRAYTGHDAAGASLGAGRRKYGSALCASPDGKKFASRAEMARYEELTKMLMRGEIEDLELQVVYKMEVNGMLVCKYLADFRYRQNGEVVVEDVKGVSTPVYLLKKKLMKACHGIDISEWRGRATSVKKSRPALEDQ